MGCHVSFVTNSWRELANTPPELFSRKDGTASGWRWPGIELACSSEDWIARTVCPLAPYRRSILCRIASSNAVVQRIYFFRPPGVDRFSDTAIRSVCAWMPQSRPSVSQKSGSTQSAGLEGLFDEFGIVCAAIQGQGQHLGPPRSCPPSIPHGCSGPLSR